MDLTETGCVSKKEFEKCCETAGVTTINNEDLDQL
jgi:hypothetical protein